MTPLPVEFDPAASEEAEEAYRWYAHRSEHAANSFLAELDKAVTAIQENPSRYAPYLHGARRYLLKRYPFAVVYRVLPEKIHVVAVAHGKRRPGYWRGRT